MFRGSRWCAWRASGPSSLAPLRNVLATTLGLASRCPRQLYDEPNREYVTDGRPMTGRASAALLRWNTDTIPRRCALLPGFHNAHYSDTWLERTPRGSL